MVRKTGRGSRFLAGIGLMCVFGLANLDARDIRVGEQIGQRLSIDYYGWSPKGVIAAGFRYDDGNFVVHYTYVIVDLVEDKVLCTASFKIGYAGIADGYLEATKKDELQEFNRLASENGIRANKAIQYFSDNPVILGSSSYRVSVDYAAESASAQDQGVDVDLPFVGLGKLSRYSVLLERLGGRKKLVTRQDQISGTIEELRYLGVVKSFLENRVAIIMVERGLSDDGEAVMSYRLFGSHLSVGF